MMKKSSQNQRAKAGIGFLSSSRENKPSRLLVFCLLFFLPTQFGKHFWPSFAFVTGLRIDYLSPTIYFTDILVLLIFIVTLISFIRRGNFRSYFARHLRKVLLSGCALLVLSVLALHAHAPLPALYGTVKLLEFVFLGIVISRTVSLKHDWKELYWVIGGGILLESLLAVLQSVLHHSVGGIFYFLGERTFSADTPGIANASVGGNLILRSYGTLPHPNVLGGYLLIFGTLFLAAALRCWRGLSKQHARAMNIVWTCLTVFFGITSMLLSMSRTAIVVACIASFAVLVQLNVQRRNKIFALGIGVVIIFSVLAFTPVGYRLRTLSFGEDSVMVREELMAVSWREFLMHPFFGVGLQNFYYDLPTDDQIAMPTIQPVHDIYLFLLSETGFVGIAFLVAFFVVTFRRLAQVPYSPEKVVVLLLLGEGVLLGILDHYEVTLQQGQLLFTVVLALAWSVSEHDHGKKLKTAVLASNLEEKYAKGSKKQIAKKG